MPQRQIKLSAAEAEGFASLQAEWDRISAARERFEARYTRAAEGIFTVRGMDVPNAQVAVDIRTQEPIASWDEPEPVAEPTEPEPVKEA